MNELTHPPVIDVRRAAQDRRLLVGQATLGQFARLLELSDGQGADNALHWQAQFESLSDGEGIAACWLHLQVEGAVPMQCQRCLTPVDMPIRVERSFRFVKSEAQAEEQDDRVDEDLLVLSRHFDLAELIEEELLLALPLVPRHTVCPVAVKMSAVDSDFDVAQAKPNPFAVLKQLK